MIKNKSTAAWQFLNDIDLVCFSHLRWNFVYQRPQHLLSRFANYTRVFYVEEPIFHDAAEKLHINKSNDNVYVVVPHLQHGLTQDEILDKQKKMINNLISVMDINRYFSWYYTPMAIPFTNHLKPEMVVYDCMDELAAFKFAPPALKENEKTLLKKADVVFTGGYSIYESKKNSHHNIYPFPSSIDKAHFATARTLKSEPKDQAKIPHPRFGFFGVIDERLDIELIGKAAAAKPEWQFIIIGPVVKIDPATLPKHKNIHYIGGKDYKELPQYLASWDVAMIPFAMNESTKFISPTKTPEYLAAGKPVISTPIKDVVSPYADNKLVHIASTVTEFVKCGETILKKKSTKAWLSKVDSFLAGNSWDRTWSEMVKHIENKISVTTTKTKVKEKAYV
ncbi:MAG TPA: glycosyltransferase family 1 protein [Chitinophagaceae bacterium]|nr:glycosyltransferase family 1 protein [Chitinophagaceae bacterium]